MENNSVLRKATIVVVSITFLLPVSLPNFVTSRVKTCFQSEADGFFFVTVQAQLHLCLYARQVNLISSSSLCQI